MQNPFVEYEDLSWWQSQIICLFVKSKQTFKNESCGTAGYYDTTHDVTSGWQRFHSDKILR